MSTRTAARVAFVPFGRLSFEELRALESDVARDAHWLRRTVRALVPAGTSTVVIDTPAHGGVWLEQALSIADVVLVILRPDAASFATLPRLEDVLQTGGRTVERAFVLNGVDVRRALTRDVVYAMEQARPGELLPFTVPEDEDVREALARQRTLVDEAKSSGAVEALWQLAEWVGAALDRTSESRAAEVVPVAQPLSGQITVALGAR